MKKNMTKRLLAALLAAAERMQRMAARPARRVKLLRLL